MKSLVVAFALGLSSVAYAADRAEPTLRFDHLSVEQGLPGSSISAMVQDAEGYMWFAVGGGLARYDGHRLRTFRPDPEDPHALSHAFIGQLFVDHEGVLWAGAGDGVLHRYDPEHEWFDRYRWDPATDPQPEHDTKPTPRPPYRISLLFEDAGGRLWVGSMGGGLRVFDRETRSFTEHYTRADLACNYPVTAYANGDELWVGCWRVGVVRFNPTAKTTTTYAHDADDPTGLTNPNVRGIVSGYDDRLWFATIGGGLNVYDPATDKIARYDTPGEALWVNDVHRDDEGILWLATETSGLVRFDPRAETFTRYSLPNGHYSVMYLYADRDDVLWLAPRVGGVYRFPISLSRFVYYRHDPDNPNSPTGGHVTDILEAEDGTVWIANADGLDRFDPVAGQFTRYKPDTNPSESPRNYLRRLAMGPDGALWICTINTGLKRFDPRTETFEHFRHDPSDPRSIAADTCEDLTFEGNTLWIATLKGLDRFNLETRRFTHFRSDPDDERTLDSDLVCVVLLDSMGTLWAGTETGLNRFDLKTQAVTRFVHTDGNPKGLAPGAVSALYEDPSGGIWVGTRAGALNLLDRNTGEFRVWWPVGRRMEAYEQEHFAAGITGITRSHGALWMTTPDGLHRLDPETEDLRHFAPGVDHTERTYSSLGRGDDVLYLGGLMGLTLFRPDEHERDTRRPTRMAITGIEVLNQSGKTIRRGVSEDPLRLRWGESVLDIEFAALRYDQSGARLYEYKLDGFHSDWMETKSPSVTFAALGPGEYTFLVRPRDADQDEVAPIASMSVLVDPPPWRTWWAYLSYALMGLVVVGGSVRYREQRREQKQLSQWNRELERRIAEATREVRETEEALIRSSQLARFGEFAASVAHDLKTPLTFIRGELELLEEAHANGQVDEELLSTTITSLLEHCRRMRTEIETAMSYVRPSDGTSPVAVRGVMEEVTRMLRVRASEGAVTMRLRTNPDLRCAAQPDSLRHVIANLVVNAIEAMPAGGTVTLSGASTPDWVEMRITDTGPGVPDDVKDRLFEPFVSTKGERGTGLGLASCKRLIEEELGGEIVLEGSQPGETTFLIRMPHAAQDSEALAS